MFIDAGQVTSTVRQLGSESVPGRYRWRPASQHPVGPVRLDVGYALNEIPGENRVQFYLAIGNPFDGCQRKAGADGFQGDVAPAHAGETAVGSRPALGGLIALSWCAQVGAVLVDAVLAQVESAVVSASDIALARALELFGFTPSDNPIDAADVDRYATALGEVLEATRLGLARAPTRSTRPGPISESSEAGQPRFVPGSTTWPSTPRGLDAPSRLTCAGVRGRVPRGLRRRAGPARARVSRCRQATRKGLRRAPFLAPSEKVAVPFPMPR